MTSRSYGKLNPRCNDSALSRSMASPSLLGHVRPPKTAGMEGLSGKLGTYRPQRLGRAKSRSRKHDVRDSNAGMLVVAL